MADQMPLELRAVVEKMIAAGESKEDIGAVIQAHTTAQTPAKPTQKEIVEGAIAERNKGVPTLPQYIADKASRLPEPLRKPVAMLGTAVTDPDVISAATLTGEIPTALNLARKVPGALEAARGPVSKALTTIGEAGKNFDITKPLAEPSKLAGYIGRKIAPVEPTAPGYERYGAMPGGTPAVTLPKGNDVAAARDAVTRGTIAQGHASYGEGGLPVGPQMTPTEHLGQGEPPPSTVEQALMNRTTPSGPDSAATVNRKFMQNQSDARHAELARTGNPPRTATEVNGPGAQPSASTQVNRPPQQPVKGNVPASRSSRGVPSATPGLTVADVEYLGLNPANKITKLTPEMIAKVKEGRVLRSQGYKNEYGLNTEMERILAESKQ